MKTAVFINKNLAYLNNRAEEYLKDNVKDFELYDDSNLVNNLKEQYDNGTRKFILVLLSSQTLSLLEWIKSVPDAVFICTSSKLTSLRGVAPNLYFSISSNKSFILTTAREFINYFSCVIYNDISDPFTDEAIQIYKIMGYPVYSLDDIKNWSNYDILILVTLSMDDLQTLLSAVKNINKKYNIYQHSIIPFKKLNVPDNVRNLAIILPKSTLYPQQNSYWNELIRNPEFSYGSTYLSIIPFLINIDIDTLNNLNIISNNLYINGIIFSYYIPLNTQIKILYENITFDPYDENIIWLINKKQLNDYKKRNIEFILEQTKKIKRVIFTNNFEKYVIKYSKEGYTNFILDGPSDLITPIMNLNMENYYICPIASSSALRNNNKFVFMNMNDNSMVETELVYYNKINKLVFILSKSENIDLESFKNTLRKNKIKYYNDIKDIPKDIVNNIKMLICDKYSYDNILDNIDDIFTKFPNLYTISIYGQYNTQEQNKSLDKLRFNENHRCIINNNSCQTFIDSQYSSESIPPYIKYDTNFLDLQSIIYILPWELNYKFGLFSNTA